jgi:hypothetical protein
LINALPNNATSALDFKGDSIKFPSFSRNKMKHGVNIQKVYFNFEQGLVPLTRNSISSGLYATRVISSLDERKVKSSKNVPLKKKKPNPRKGHGK